VINLFFNSSQKGVSGDVEDKTEELTLPGPLDPGRSFMPDVKIKSPASVWTLPSLRRWKVHIS